MEHIFSTDSNSVQPKGPAEFYSGDCAPGKVGYPDISRTVVGQRIKLTLIQVEWGIQRQGNEWSSSESQSLSGPLGLQTHPLAIVRSQL